VDTTKREKRKTLLVEKFVPYHLEANVSASGEKSELIKSFLPY